MVERLVLKTLSVVVLGTSRPTAKKRFYNGVPNIRYAVFFGCISRSAGDQTRGGRTPAERPYHLIVAHIPNLPCKFFEPFAVPSRLVGKRGMKRDSKQVLTELLVLRSQGGEERAFTQLYELWAKDVLTFARFVVKDSQAAEEIAQEGWVSVAKALRKLDDAARFRAWLFRIVRRRCIDWLRKRQTERKGLDALQVDQNSTELRREPEEIAVLSEAIQKLDTDSRLLVHLFYESELTVAEVAVALELPTGTVKSRLYAVREKLRKELERKLK